MNPKKPFQVKKKFGQHFLINEDLAQQILDHIDYFLDSLHGVASGAIILMLYSSPIKEQF